MSRLVLAGGTDVGEMAFFSADALPPKADDASLAELVTADGAIRLRAGADGPYLLHVYVDEAPPPEIEAWLDTSDKLEGNFESGSGQVAFGGVESACSDFEPNPAIRTDAEIPPGRYRAIAFHTDYPDERLEEQVEARIGKAGADKLRRPGNIFIVAALLVVSMIIMGVADTPWYFAGAAVLAAAAWLWIRSITGTAEFRDLEREKLDVEQRFPSIVIALERLDASAPS